MALIEWRREFEIGITSVDHEHKSMVALINELHARLSADPSRAEVSDFLARIHKEISAHFALEERIMRETGYDDFAPHKEEHEHLLDEIREIMDAYEADDRFDFGDALSERLKAWFTNHFKTRDSRLHRMLG